MIVLLSHCRSGLQFSLGSDDNRLVRCINTFIYIYMCRLEFWPPCSGADLGGFPETGQVYQVIKIIFYSDLQW